MVVLGLTREPALTVASSPTVEDRYPGFATWYQQEHPKVLAALVWVSGNPEVAREATDEAFARAIAKWSRVRVMDSPGGWLYTVALNLVRRQASRGAAERRVADLAHTAVALADSTTELWLVVQQLPTRQRVAVVLRYMLDLKEADIAAVMRVAPGTVASTLAAARTRLAGWLDDDAEEGR
jgi:RNA polymerase sigma-70 factor (ECF subfamily)